MRNVFSIWPLTLLIGLSSIGLIGCSRYEEGPAISFSSREARVVNNWRATSLVRNDIDETSFYVGYGMQFSDNGNFVWQIDRVDDTVGVQEIPGKWRFIGTDRTIEVEYDEPDPLFGHKIIHMDIRRLTEDEMNLTFIYQEDYYDVDLR